MEPGDVLKVLVTLRLYASLMGIMTSFKVTGVEILLLDRQCDGNIDKNQCVELLMKSGLIETRSQRLFPIVVGYSFLGQEGLPQSTHEKIEDVAVTIQ
jgi:hypothetical protein